jgi:hypothetical protein
MQAEAIGRLNDVAAVNLSDKELRSFAPSLGSTQDGQKPYLIRGVFLQGPDGRPMGTGHFVCFSREKDVLVHFGCLGRKFWGLAKGPLVIQLPATPERVYVMCSMAE